MSHISPWFVILVYLIPIIGTLASIRRRSKSIWSVSDSIRKLFPEDRLYRKIKEWEKSYTAWRSTYRVGAYINLATLNRFAGKAEYAFGHVRDYVIGVYMMAAFVFDTTYMVLVPHVRAEHFTTFFYHGFFAFLSIWTYRRHVSTGLMMTEFMRVNPHVHPQEFFEHYYRHLGPSTTPIPTKATQTVNPTHISYRTGKKPRQSFWLLMKGFYDTAIFARSAYTAMETIGPEYGREVFDVMASLWGSRMLQIFEAELIVEGTEKFHGLSGKIILVFNHKSHLDFVFNFFGLSATHLASGRKLRPRYMAAKDHFVDNKVVYSGLGIGKLIENVDMVFVDRKGKGKDAVFDACQRLGSKDIEIAMYPQGTRSVANYGSRGERLDAGYYTTGTAKTLKSDLGHLKKGCAFLAIDTARAMREQNIPVHLVFIGIDGTATLVPKGSFKVQTEGLIKFTVGDIFTLNPEEVDDLTEEKKDILTDKIQSAIDAGLTKALGLHEKLREQFLEDVSDMNLIPKEKRMLVSHTLHEGKSNLPFMILDRIYALSFKEQKKLLQELAGLLAENKPLVDLRDRVTDQLFKHRGAELKAIQEQEKARKI